MSRYSYQISCSLKYIIPGIVFFIYAICLNRDLSVYIFFIFLFVLIVLCMFHIEGIMFLGELAPVVWYVKSGVFTKSVEVRASILGFCFNMFLAVFMAV